MAIEIKNGAIHLSGKDSEAWCRATKVWRDDIERRRKAERRLEQLEGCFPYIFGALIIVAVSILGMTI